MNLKKLRGLHANYIVIGIEALILLSAFCFWLLNRQNAYSKTFTLDEYVLTETVVVKEDVTTDETMGPGGIFLSTPPLSLKKGVYRIQVDYNADREGSILYASCGLGAMETHSAPLELDPESHSAVMTLEIARSTDDVVIDASFSGSGYLSITNLGIHETSARYKKNIFYAFLLCLLISLGYFFKCSKAADRQVILALCGIFLAACYPLYTDFITPGHDLPFHLIRIDAVSEGLSQGIFPVKLHPLWAKGNGYAAGIFYGDAFLYFPALLRLMGFSIQWAYKCFVAFINLGTVLISYYSFRKIFSDRKSGMLGCLAYTLAPYRLMDVYTRASAGEYTAMMFFPLILCGIYLIFRDEQGENRRHPVILTALGMTGLIQSHILSCLMAVFVLLFVCILLIRRLFRPRVFSSLVSSAALTLALNLGFIVPFLDFYREDIMINSPEWTGSTIGTFQDNGLFPIQLFTLFHRSSGGAWAVSAGISTEPAFGIGIFLTIGMLLFVYLLCTCLHSCRNSSHFYPALLCLLCGCLLLYMSTCCFPWDALASAGDFLKNVIYSLEFPWRLLAPATVLLTCALCFAFDTARKCLAKSFGGLLTGSLILLAVSCGWYFYDFSYTAEPYRIYDTYELNTMTMYSCDYLPAGTDLQAVTVNPVLSEGTAVTSYQKRGTDIVCSVSAGETGGTVDFPLIYYKYYRCTDIDTSRQLPVCAGTNNMVRAEFPAGYCGSIRIHFSEPWFWRLSEIVSAVSLCTAVILLILPLKRKSPCSRRSARHS